MKITSDDPNKKYLIAVVAVLVERLGGDVVITEKQIAAAPVLDEVVGKNEFVLKVIK